VHESALLSFVAASSQKELTVDFFSILLQVLFDPGVIVIGDLLVAVLHSLELLSGHASEVCRCLEVLSSTEGVVFPNFLESSFAVWLEDDLLSLNAFMSFVIFNKVHWVVGSGSLLLLSV